MDKRIILTGLLFAGILVSGLVLSRNGKPYSMVLFNIHKLAALGTAVYLAVSVIRIHRVAPLGGPALAVWILSAVCFVILAASGGVVSAVKNYPPVVHTLHQFAPYLAVISAGLGIYFTLMPAG